MMKLYTDNPERAAIRHRDKDYTYAELTADARRFCAYIQSQKVKRIAIMMPKESWLYAAIWGGYYAGVTVGLINHAYPTERKKRCLGLICPELILTRDHIEGWPTVTPEKVLSQDSVPCEAATPNEIALILFTSGSTGQPKGVKLCRVALEHTIGWCRDHCEMRADDICGQYSDVSFDMGVCDVFYALSVGATLVPIDGFEKTVPAMMIKKYGITYWYSVPTVVDFMMARKDINAGNLKTLRTIGFGGAALYREHVEKLFAAVPSLRIFNTYGPTEITIFSSYVCMDRQTYERYTTDTVCLGKPIAGMTYEYSEPEGNSREIIAVSNHNFAGYLHDPRDMEKKDPIVRFPTGDLVREEKGELFFVARRDNMVKINGNRVDLDEIDTLLRKNLGVPAVSLASGGSIHTFIDKSCSTDTAEIHRLLARHLPVYALPRSIRLIPGIPQTANQKYDRNKLREFIE